MKDEIDDLADRMRDQRDAVLRRKLEDRLVPGLPLDSDVPLGRSQIKSVGSAFDKILESLLVERCAFYEEVCEKWKELFPDLAARPGRWQGPEPAKGRGRAATGRLFLYVSSAPLLFALRSRLAGIRSKLAQLPSAPARFTVHLEIHAPPRKRTSR